MHQLCVIYLLTFAGILTSAATVVNNNVTVLKPGSIYDYHPRLKRTGFFQTDLHTYCYNGTAKDVTKFLESLKLHLDIEGDDYTQYEGTTPEEVVQHYEAKLSLFSFNIFTQKRTKLSLSPFAPKCIGIVSGEPYRLTLIQERIDVIRVFLLLSGTFMFLYARKLSENPLFYYITGIILGISLSFMLLIWLSSKLFPRRTMTYGILIGGWTIGVYMLQKIWENLQVILVTYHNYVLGYIITTGIIAFFFCYRMGPPKNQRSKDIIRWLMQLLSLVLIYYSSHFEAAAVAAAIIVVVINYFPLSLIYKLRGYYLRYFPPKRRLLSSEEFYEQGVLETSKALEELRTFVSSPKCKQWQVITKLKDPLRFASFVEGSSHLSDDEMLSFEEFRQNVDSEESSSESDNVPYNSTNVQPQPKRNHKHEALTDEDDISEDDNYITKNDRIYNQVKHAINENRAFTSRTEMWERKSTPNGAYVRKSIRESNHVYTTDSDEG
ncbi:nuclear envelope integral membrane protein 1a [Teleopsis dalmanni]|uniref:nuclear envelope integral membrane protein 1a n=1 Tax=Teleopsis dalmanni TaxID=139649 RepID=UPI0018CD06A1|nr:nuclear envelope integral membrane protein 1a [Teleopsis dalmanni]